MTVKAVGNPPLGQIIRRHLDGNLVASEHANAIFRQAASKHSFDAMPVIEFDGNKTASSSALAISSLDRKTILWLINTVSCTSRCSCHR
jgi:hypothetical protein